MSIPATNQTSSSAGNAVFVSYASQDALAAKRICDALRAAGVEVWFDQNELGGGDAWDAKIRGQIGACVLFVPVISAATQARREGYFRLEWKLADERTHLMAEGTPFVLPVVIDDTKERAALVPKSFLAVQWTRLPGGETTEAFCGRVKKLLAGNLGARASSPGIHDVAGGTPALPVKPVGGALRARLAWGVGVAVLVGGIAAFLWLRRPAAEPGKNLRQDAAATPQNPVPAGPRLGAKSIAVLPFDNLSEDKDANAFFADGMHEDVITNLLLIRELRCVPRTTAMTYRGTKKTNREIADELGVAYLLTGTVRRADKKVRITGTLINARTDEPLWSKPYDKDITDAGVIFAIQSELAQAIAGELKATLSPQEKKLVERRPTENAAAYDLFLQARELRNDNLGGATSQKAEALLQAAVALDSKFAIAWSELAFVRGYRYFFNYDHTPECLSKAKVAIDTAVRIAPEDPEVVHNRGYHLVHCEFDLPLAAEQFQKLARIQPGSAAPRFGLAVVQRNQGKFKESLDGYLEAAEREPGNYDYAVQVSLMSHAGRKWAEAAAARRRLMEMRPTSSAAALSSIATIAFRASGSTREMEEVLAQLTNENASSTTVAIVRRNLALMRGDLAEFASVRPRLTPNATNLNLQVLPVVTALSAQGKVPEARAMLADAPAMLRARLEREPENANLWSDLGMVEALLGRKEEALRCSRKAVELIPETVNPYYGPNYRVDLAFVHAWTGDKELALDEYARLLRTPMTQGSNGRNAATLNVHVMQHHPFYFPLQGDPRFESLLNDPKNNAPLF